jgi:hypothetical protein
MRHATNQRRRAEREETDETEGVQSGQCWKFHLRLTGCPQPNKPVELTAKKLAFWPQLTASVRLRYP